MSKLKTWVVKTERIKDKSYGLQEYACYLVAKNHKNHKKTTIVPILGNVRKLVSHTIANCFSVDYKNKQSGKGGSPIQSYAQSFTFNLPKGYKATEEQWQLIGERLAFDFCQHMGLPFEYADRFLFLNAHMQGNEHLNLIASRCWNNGVLYQLDQKSTLNFMKQKFTQLVLDVCEFRVEDYQVKNPTPESKYSQTYPQWQKNFRTLIMLADRWISAVKMQKEKEKEEIQNEFEAKYKEMLAVGNNAILNRINKILQQAEESSGLKMKF